MSVQSYLFKPSWIHVLLLKNLLLLLFTSFSTLQSFAIYGSLLIMNSLLLWLVTFLLHSCRYMYETIYVDYIMAANSCNIKVGRIVCLPMMQYSSSFGCQFTLDALFWTDYTHKLSLHLTVFKEMECYKLSLKAGPILHNFFCTI